MFKPSRRRSAAEEAIDAAGKGRPIALLSTLLPFANMVSTMGR